MKKILLLTIIIASFFYSCSKQAAPVIGMTMSYWEGKYAINKSYVDAIRDNGGRVRLIPCTDDPELLQKEIDELDGIVFIGGRDYIPEWYGKKMHPTMVTMDLHRAAFDTLFMNMAFESGKPVLGICAGIQLMNIVTDGKLFRDIPDHRGVDHIIYTVKGSIINDIYGDTSMVNSSHHQSVDPAFLNDHFKVTAWSADSTVECIEWQGDKWIVGTQFHPERLPKAQRDKIIGTFLHECK